MNTGQMPSVSSDLNVGADRKKQINVNGPDVMTQSSSRGRGPYMDLESGEVNPMMDCEEPSGNKDY